MQAEVRAARRHALRALAPRGHQVGLLPLLLALDDLDPRLLARQGAVDEHDDAFAVVRDALRVEVDARDLQPFVVGYPRGRARVALPPLAAAASAAALLLFSAHGAIICGRWKGFAATWLGCYWRHSVIAFLAADRDVDVLRPLRWQAEAVRLGQIRASHSWECVWHSRVIEARRCPRRTAVRGEMLDANERRGLQLCSSHLRTTSCRDLGYTRVAIPPLRGAAALAAEQPIGIALKSTIPFSVSPRHLRFGGAPNETEQRVDS